MWHKPSTNNNWLVEIVVFAIHLIREAYVGNRFNSAICSPTNKWGNPLSFLSDFFKVPLEASSLLPFPEHMMPSAVSHRLLLCSSVMSQLRGNWQCFPNHPSLQIQRPHEQKPWPGGDTQRTRTCTRTHNHFLSLPKKTTICICQNKATVWLIQANIIGSNRQGFVSRLANGVAVAIWLLSLTDPMG